MASLWWRVQEIAFEIGLLEQYGLDINDPKEMLPGRTISALELLCIMYAGFKRIEPGMDIGVDLGEESDTAMDPEFLMEQMELRENLDEARNAGDRGERLGILQRQVDELFEARSADLSRQFLAATDEARRRARNLEGGGGEGKRFPAHRF